MRYLDEWLQNLLSDLNNLFEKEKFFRKLMIQDPNVAQDTLPFYFDSLIDLTHILIDKIRDFQAQTKSSSIQGGLYRLRDGDMHKVDMKTASSQTIIKTKNCCP